MVVPDASAYDWPHVSKTFGSNPCAYTHSTTSPVVLITPTIHVASGGSKTPFALAVALLRSNRHSPQSTPVLSPLPSRRPVCTTRFPDLATLPDTRRTLSHLPILLGRPSIDTDGTRGRLHRAASTSRWLCGSCRAVSRRISCHRHRVVALLFSPA